MATLPTTTTRTRPTCVIADGPYAEANRYGDEFPVWYVYVADDDGEALGKVYTCKTQSRAQGLAAAIARDRRLEYVNEAGPA